MQIISWSSSPTDIAACRAFSTASLICGHSYEELWITLPCIGQESYEELWEQEIPGTAKRVHTWGVLTPSHLASSYPNRSDCVAILDGAILMTAAASLEGTSSFSDVLNSAMNTTPPEFTVTYEEWYAHHATNLDPTTPGMRFEHRETREVTLSRRIWSATGKIIYGKMLISKTNRNLKTSACIIVSGLRTCTSMFCVVQRRKRAPAEVTRLDVHHGNPPKPIPQACFWQLITWAGVYNIAISVYNFYSVWAAIQKVQ